MLLSTIGIVVDWIPEYLKVMIMAMMMM